ncbi:phage tail protein [Parasedimentitalea marina]|uniref:Phage tail protein n=1 Tax=Parasedimentitalea marina TaxID=2483033 RepID=A0A3T0N1H3_9RHOB|nr:contractile injection system protein, VgrG/Pvc8 family [Parasedimentitalea marina]AZV77874.1 phage tail protein [Parasedimentitalea marina]
MTPDFQIIANSVDQTAQFKDRLVNLTLTDQAGQKSDTAQITLDNRDNRIELPDVGAVLDISLGLKETGLVPMGRYVVDELSGDLFPNTLTISAKAADMLGGIKAPKTRNWDDVTVQDIVAKIAGENGLETAVAESLKAHFYGYLAQTAESDLNFLTRLARDLDATAKPAGGALVFIKRGIGKAADGSDLPVPVINVTQMSRGNWKASGRGKYSKVIAEWSELGAAKVRQVSAGDGEPLLKLRHRYASQNEAQRAADSALESSKRASGKASIQLAGFDGGLLAEGFVDLQGIHPGLSGKWLVTQVTHRLGNTLITSFDGERDNDA